MQAAEFIRSRAFRLWALNVAKKEEVSLSQLPSPSPRAQRQLLPPEPLDDMTNEHEGIDRPTLFAHLMKLSQDEAAAAVAAPVQTARKKEAPPRVLSGKTSTLGDDLAAFKRDSADVRRWMKHALEDLHIDAIVVASAATLASQYLRRRYWLRSNYRIGGGDGDGGGGGGGNSDSQRGASRKSAAVSLLASYDAPAAASTAAAGELHRGRRLLGGRSSGGSGKGNVQVVLLSVTCIHLANKYHAGCDEEVAGFGASVKWHRVLKLGLDMSLSMGTFLNASFRANPVALQGLFCNMADESAVVRACSEWFALCLVLLLHPSNEDWERPTTQLGQRTPSPATSIGTGATSSCSTSPASSDLDAKGATDPPCTPSCPNLKTSSVAEQCGGNAHHRFPFATSLALGALVLARRLARSEGPCLPPRVQALIGVDNDESLQLVAEGIDAARSAFETIVVDASIDSAEEDSAAGVTGGGGRDILAGGIVFGRVIAGVPPGDRVVAPGGDATNGSARAERRTLLEWVSGCRGGAQAHRDTANDAGQVCPDSLACDEELGSLDRDPVRRGEKTADGGYVDFVRGIPLSVAEAVGSVPLSSGGAGSSGCPTSPKSDGDSAVDARDCGDSTDTLAYSASAKNSTDGSGKEEEEERQEEKEENEEEMEEGKEEDMGEEEEDMEEEEEEEKETEEEEDDDVEEESETQGERSIASCGSMDEEDASSATPGGNRGANEGSMSSDMDGTDLSESPYPSPSPMNVSKMQASHHDIRWKLHTPIDEVGSLYRTPGTDDTPPPFCRRDAMDVVGDVETYPQPRWALPPAASVPRADVGAELAAHLERNVAATRRSSRKRLRLSSEKIADDSPRQRSDQGPNKRYKTKGRELSSQEDLRRLRSARGPQQEREARWEIMKGRVVAALEYRCGCSFCKLGGVGVFTTTTTSGVEEGGKKRRQAQTKATP